MTNSNDGDIDILKREMDAVIKVLQINLVRGLTGLDELDEDFEKSEHEFWMRDLPIQKIIREYRKTVSNVLTSYTQLENVYKDYFNKLHGYMKAFDVNSIRDELDNIYRDKIVELQKQVKDVEHNREMVDKGFEQFKKESIANLDALNKALDEISRLKKEVKGLKIKNEQKD